MIPKYFESVIEWSKQKFFSIEIYKYETSSQWNSSNRKLYFNYAGEQYLYEWNASPMQGFAQLYRMEGEKYKTIYDAYGKSENEQASCLYQTAQDCCIEIRK